MGSDDDAVAYQAGELTFLYRNFALFFLLSGVLLSRPCMDCGTRLHVQLLSYFSDFFIVFFFSSQEGLLGGGEGCARVLVNLSNIFCAYTYIHTYIHTRTQWPKRLPTFASPPPLPKGKKKEKKRKEPCHKSLHISYSE